MTCQTIYSINALTLLAAEKDPGYAEVLYRGDLLLADGIGAVWAIRRLTGKQAERVPGVDLILNLAEACAAKGRGVFLLGGQPGVAEKAARRLCEVVPGLAIAGCHDGFWPADQDEVIVSMINQSRAGLLFIGLGQPRQERFLDRFHDRLQVGMAMGVGGSFDVLSGRLRRAPHWMQRCGLEWLFRVLQQPSRIPRVFGLLEFAWRVIRSGKHTKEPRELS